MLPGLTALPARCLFSVWFGLLASGSTEGGGPKREATGVVVEDVAKESAAAKAGIQAGDVILAWSRAPAPPANPQPARGRIRSPFDLAEVEVEQAPRGVVTLSGWRGDRKATWTLRLGTFGLTVRPSLAATLLALYREGKELLESQRLEDGAGRWLDAAASAENEQGWLAPWFLSKAGRALAASRKWEEADAPYAEAIERVEQSGPTMAAQLLREWGRSFQQRNAWDRAEYCYRQAVAKNEQLVSESLAIALSLNSLGTIAWRRGDLATAEQYYRRAMEVRDRLAPGSADVAKSLNNLGIVADTRGELATAATYYQRSLVILEKMGPDSFDVAGTLENLGAVARDRGDLRAAEDYHRRSLVIRETLAPGSLDVGESLLHLGLVARDRGDLAAAEDYLWRALAIEQRQAPGSLPMAASLNNLGSVAWIRGDLAVAQDYFRQSLAIKEKLAPGSLDVARSLNNLGTVVGERGDLAGAEQYHRRSLAIKEKLAPRSLSLAASLRSLGDVARARRDVAAAEEYERRALAILEEVAPASLDLAETLHTMGDLASNRGDLAAAEDHHRRSLTIREELAPGSAAEAESLHSLALTYHRAGNLELGADFVSSAIDALESQKTKLGGTEEARSAFGAKYADYYRDCLEVLLELGWPDDALHVLERSRARSLLEMLAERDLLFMADLPAEIAGERKLADADYDRTQAAIAKLNPAKDGEEIERLLSRLRELREKQEEIASRIRKASPRFASLHYPEPLDLEGVQKALDPATVLLAYSVGKEKSVLFVVQPGDLSVFSLPVGDKALREKVKAFRNVIERRDAASREVLAGHAADLYDILLKPAESLIASSERVLVSPDGPLHTLPFAALMQEQGKKGQKPRYLIEWKPLHVVVSATVYAELKKSRREGGTSPSLLAAFGDPRYPPLSKEQAEEIPNPELRSVVRRGVSLSPLPFTRHEVEAVAGLSPETTLKYLGEQATEERAKAVGKDVRYLHFACHGLLDERFPLNSALALTIPERFTEGQDNGLLQAWEIFEHVRIDADLVTLSACETALGTEMGGEGLVGLTRAFQYAGARSVLASLWSVADESTAELMKGFYSYLKAGKSKDEALRAAQVDLIRAQGNASHPFHWGAFELIGDWR